MMQAVVVSSFGASDVLQLADVEMPSGGEILVKVESASVSPLDVVLRKGTSVGPYTPNKLPYIPGFGVAGTVVKALPGSRFEIGDRVWGMKNEGGGYAEYSSYDDGELEFLPDSISFEAGATIDTPYRTSIWALFDLGKACSGETVVVSGAAKSVGSACLRVAKAAGIATIALCSAHDMDLVTASGADFVFDYRRNDLAEEIMKSVRSSEISVFVDVATVKSVPLAHKILRGSGTHVVVGPEGHSPLLINPLTLMEKGLNMVGVALYNASPARHLEISAEIKDGFDRKVYKVHEPTSLPLGEVKRAHELVETDKYSGGLVLVPYS